MQKLKTDCTWKLKIQEVDVKFQQNLLDLLEMANMSGSVIRKWNNLKVFFLDPVKEKRQIWKISKRCKTSLTSRDARKRILKPIKNKVNPAGFNHDDKLSCTK